MASPGLGCSFDRLPASRGDPRTISTTAGGGVGEGALFIDRLNGECILNIYRVMTTGRCMADNSRGLVFLFGIEWPEIDGYARDQLKIHFNGGIRFCFG